MKKVFQFATAALILSVTLSSCGLFGGKKGTCPAYNKTETLKTQSVAE